jgi:adenosylcobinamide-phosphate synthase
MDCRLGGPNFYKGVLVEKPFIGESERVVEHGEFARVRYVNQAVTFFVVMAGVIYFFL